MAAFPSARPVERRGERWRWQSQASPTYILTCMAGWAVTVTWQSEDSDSSARERMSGKSWTPDTWRALAGLCSSDVWWISDSRERGRQR
jgi:hypothetical protein